MLVLLIRILIDAASAAVTQLAAGRLNNAQPAVSKGAYRRNVPERRFVAPRGELFGK